MKIHDLSEGGKKDLVMHLRNVQNAVCFIQSHEDCIELDDSDLGALQQALSVMDRLDNPLNVNVKEGNW